MNDLFAYFALAVLCHVARARTNEMQNFNCARALSDSDDERVSTHAIYVKFLQSIKPLGIKKSHFSPAEIEILYDCLQVIVSFVWNRENENC